MIFFSYGLVEDDSFLLVSSNVRGIGEIDAQCVTVEMPQEQLATHMVVLKELTVSVVECHVLDLDFTAVIAELLAVIFMSQTDEFHDVFIPRHFISQFA